MSKTHVFVQYACDTSIAIARVCGHAFLRVCSMRVCIVQYAVYLVGAVVVVSH